MRLSADADGQRRAARAARRATSRASHAELRLRDEGDRDPPGEALRRTRSSACSKRSTARSAPPWSRRCSSDVLAALDRAEAIERVIVVTGEGRAERLACATPSAPTTPLEVMEDPTTAATPRPRRSGSSARSRSGARCSALLPGDCPLLDPAELDGALGRMRDGRVAVIPDRHGTGTNGLLLAPADAIGPAFGEGSRERHVDRAARRGLRGRGRGARLARRSTSTPPTTSASSPRR